MIAVRDLMIRQGAFTLRDVTFAVPTGKYGVLMGPTGCGKTSLLETVAGLRPVASGRVMLGPTDVTDLPPASRGVGYVPQDAALFPTMAVRDQLGFALSIRRAPAKEIDNRVSELAGWLGINHVLDRRPVNLSGGEAQRVALGRALSFRPDYLLMDEPLSSLDEAMRDALIRLLQELRNEGRVTVLHVTHSRPEAEQLADVLFRLEGGQVREGS